MEKLVSSILVAYDGSKLSIKALKFAENIAKQDAGIQLHILTVKRKDYYPYMFPGAMVYYNDNKNDELDQEFAKMLEEAASLLAVNNPVNTHLKTGDPGQTITQFAKENDIGLIVMGNRGLGAVKEFFLGSVSHYVVHSAECPVLIVK